MGRVGFRLFCRLLLGVLHLTRQDSPSPRQINSDLVRSIHSDPNSLSLTQIHPISLRFALTHSDSSNLTQICSAFSSFTQIRSGSQNFTQSHSDSLNLAQICSDLFSCTQIHSVLLQILSDSHRLIQIRSDSFRFAQTCSDKLQLTNPEGKREMLPARGQREKGRRERSHFIPDST